jgi:hypothetical protein
LLEGLELGIVLWCDISHEVESYRSRRGPTPPFRSTFLTYNPLL